MFRRGLQVCLKCINRPTTFILSRNVNNSLVTSSCHLDDQRSVLVDPNLPQPDTLEKYNLQSVLSLQQIDTFEKIQKLGNTQDMLQFLRNNENIITPLYGPVFSQIYKLFQSNGSKMSKELFVRSKEFENFCKHLKKSVRGLRPSDILAILKTLKRLDVSMNSILCQQLLHVLSKSINDLTISQIIYSNFLISGAPSSPIVDALKLSLPIVFDINVRTKLNYNDSKSLIAALHFASNSKASQGSIDVVVDALLLLQDQLTVLQCKDIASALCSISVLNVSRKKLFRFCMNKINEAMLENLSLGDVLFLHGVMVNSFLFSNTFFYDEVFMLKVGEFAINKRLNLLDAGKILRAYIRISYVHLDLINYIDDLLIKFKFDDIQGYKMIFMSFISSCSNACYLPPNWKSYEGKIIENLIDDTHTANLPLARIALELLALDRWHVPFLEKILSEDFIRAYLNRKRNQLDYLVILNLYQAISTLNRSDIKVLPPPDVIEHAGNLIRQQVREFPLKPALERLFGGELFVMNKIYTKYHHYIDHLVVLNKQGYPIPLKDQGVVDGHDLDNIVLPKNGYPFAIIVLLPTAYCIDGIKLRGKHKMYLDSIGTQGVIPVPISSTIWDSLQDAEKLPFLKREIFSRIPGDDADKKIL